MASRSKKTLTQSTITVLPAEPLLLGKSPLDNPKRPRPCPPRDRIPRPVLFLHPSSPPPERAPPLRCFSSSIALSIYLLSSVILCINQLVFLVYRLGRLTAPVTHTPSYPAFDVPHNPPLHSRLSSTDRPKIRFPHLGRSVPCDHRLRTLVATSMNLGTAI